MNALPHWSEAVDERVKYGHAPGMVALVGYPESSEVWSAGYRDLASGEPMTCDTLFRIASVTKVITTIACLMLVDDGILELDEPLSPWLPELGNESVVQDIYGPFEKVRKASAPVTLRTLLSMTFGMGAYFGQREFSPLIDKMNGLQLTSWTAPIAADDFMARVADLPLMFDPGRRWLYHLGFEIAGILVERLTGERLGAFMDDRIFQPLEMIDTGFSIKEEDRSRLSSIYVTGGNGRFQQIADWSGDRSSKPLWDRGGGGLISSASDLGKIGRLLLGRGQIDGVRLLSQWAVDEMTRNQVSTEAMASSPVFEGFWDSYDYGLGVCISKKADDISPFPGRFGWWGGTGTALFADPERNVVLISLTQQMIERIDDSGNADAFMRSVLTPEG